MKLIKRSRNKDLLQASVRNIIPRSRRTLPFATQNVRAVIFDMDGVLIDSEPFHLETNIKLFKEYGIDYRAEYAHEFFGLGIKEFYKKIHQIYKKEVPYKEASDKDIEMMTVNYQKFIPINPQAKATLLKLQSLYNLALATSTPRKLALSALKRLNIIKFFDAMVFGDQVTKGKPNPEIYLKVAEKINRAPSECIIIEDSLNGIKAGIAAGIKTIAYKAEHNNRINFSLADFRIEDLREIPGILEKLNKES